MNCVKIFVIFSVRTFDFDVVPGHIVFDKFMYNTMFYDNFYLQGEGKRLNTNTAIHVIADLDTCYLVTVEDDFGYVPKEMVSEKKIISKKTPAEKVVSVKVMYVFKIT